MFGRLIGASQALSHPLADAYARLKAAWHMVMVAGWRYDTGLPCGEEANTAKYLAAEAGYLAADRAMQTHGGVGYASEYHVERYSREARSDADRAGEPGDDAQLPGAERAGPAEELLTMSTRGEGRLAGRVAIVLGGGADGPPAPGETMAIGNGRAIALRLAAEGARVAVVDRDNAAAAATVEALATRGLVVHADLTDIDACRSIVPLTEASLGSGRHRGR